MSLAVAVVVAPPPQGTGTTISKEIDTGGVNLTQLALLPNARVMFAATEAGGVRTYKYPLTGAGLRTGARGVGGRGRRGCALVRPRGRHGSDALDVACYAATQLWPRAVLASKTDTQPLTHPSIPCIHPFKPAGEFQEAKCHAAPVSRLRVSWDESLLVSGGEDGSVFVWEVRDKDARAAARREQEKLEYAVEVLVTRWVQRVRGRVRESESEHVWGLHVCAWKIRGGAGMCPSPMH